METRNKELRQQILLVNSENTFPAELVRSMTEYGLSVLLVNKYSDAKPLLEEDAVNLAVLAFGDDEDVLVDFASRMFMNYPDVVMVVLSDTETTVQNRLLNLGVHSFLPPDMGASTIAGYLKEENTVIACEKFKIAAAINDYSFDTEREWARMLEERCLKSIKQAGSKKL